MPDVFKNFDLGALRRNRQIAFYFRYPLYHSEFHELRDAVTGRLLGRFAAKPLYGQLTKEGKVDRSRGFNGQIAILFLPARARRVGAAQIFLARMPKEQVTLSNGRRNWPAIRRIAEQAVRRRLRQNKGAE